MNEIQQKLAPILQSAAPNTRLFFNASMKEHCSFRAGGTADLLAIPGTEQDLKTVLQTIAEANIPSYLMGNGSNLLVRDGGYRGVIVRIGAELSQIRVTGTELFAQAGALLSVIAAEACTNQLAGFEFASGIPGSLGGALSMNAGAYGGEMKQIVKEVRLLSRDGNRERIATVDEMEFSYRKSCLEETGEIALSAVLRLIPGEKQAISDCMKTLMAQRNEKQPVCYPSAGSFFKRPEGHFAGKLIEDAGLMGERVGGASISTLHAGFLINDKQASASDILMLMARVQDRVFAQFGVVLEPEVRIIGEE